MSNLKGNKSNILSTHKRKQIVLENINGKKLIKNYLLNIKFHIQLLKNGVLTMKYMLLNVYRQKHQTSIEARTNSLDPNLRETDRLKNFLKKLRWKKIF